MPNKKRIRIVLAIAAVLCVGVICIKAQQATPTATPQAWTEEQFREFMNKVREWKIIVDAHIVDDAGNEINGVLCRADKLGPGSWDATSREEYIRTKNPRMHMEFDRVMAVNLIFHDSTNEKIGAPARYESFEITLDTKEPLPSAVVDIPNGIQRYNLTVVLNRIPEQKDVIEFNEYLKFDTSVENVIFLLDNLGGESPHEASYGRFLYLEPNVPRPDFAHLYLEVVDAPGVEATFRTDPNWGTQHVITPADKALELVMQSANPEDGIVLEPGTSEDFKKDRIPWRMTTAPESGYSQRVRIPKETCTKANGNSLRQAYFYFRYAGKYGRGRLYLMGYDCDDSSASCRAKSSIDIEYQLDGTRQIR